MTTWKIVADRAEARIIISDVSEGSLVAESELRNTWHGNQVELVVASCSRGSTIRTHTRLML